MDNLLHACEYAHLSPGRDPTAFVILSKASTTQEGLLASGIKKKKWLACVFTQIAEICLQRSLVERDVNCYPSVKMLTDRTR